MKINQITFQNLDLVLLTCEALNILTVRDMSSYTITIEKLSWPLLSSLDIHRIRSNNYLRNENCDTVISYQQLNYCIYILVKIIQDENIKSQIHNILKFDIKSNKYFKVNSTDIKNYKVFLKRFYFLFRKYFNIQAVGIEKYNNDNFLSQIAITNIYMLYILQLKNGYDNFCSYLANYDFIDLSYNN